ncbi:copper resistance protein CopC [Planococcus sp. CPCC 101016]|uniref:copper resistance CopC family protein n=1 Tax=Planococcus sp. CPCC 101016 TaxID=2599617 RepID=UPI0011B5DDD6|nr:copper resistance CopC family protein [Planococcus sp. CPCC 101016]TWT06877.1 copper resistance protein CopC [Planococcus sp. CPCC 101016]
MYKKFFVLLFLILIIPFSVQAHTTLLSSTPAEGENVTEPLKEVALLFGTKIEEGSTMTIEGENGSFEFDTIAIEGDSMVGTFTESLTNGSYHILWNIIGEDGHPIEGVIAFGVSIETEEEAAAVPAATEKAEEPEEQVIVSSEEAAEAQTGNDNNLLVTVLLVFAAVLIVYGIYRLLMKKK